MSDLFQGDVSRRQLLTNAGLGIVSATAIASLPDAATAQQSEASPQPTPRGGELPPQIQFPPIQAKTEEESGGPPTALPRERRLGFACVGLGRLSLEEIMPAFGESKLAKPVALVSGDRAKAQQVAQQYSIKPQNIYQRFWVESPALLGRLYKSCYSFVKVWYSTRTRR